jgi:putative ABC transport system substrate-binding protein
MHGVPIASSLGRQLHTRFRMSQSGSGGADHLESGRQAGVYVAKILKGAKPADLPIERATNFELVLNMKTAKAIGVKISDSFRVRADKVIE